MDARDDDLYGLLGVSKTAGDGDIRKAYLQAALKWHPDKNPDEKERAEDMFKRLARAYHVLSNARRRAAYDQSGLSGLGREAWSTDPGSSMDMAYDYYIQFFVRSGLHWFYQSPEGMSPTKGFSEAKLRELFPELFGKHAGERRHIDGQGTGEAAAAEAKHSDRSEQHAASGTALGPRSRM
mmetsp:Transcript_47836/g.96508  ORF Transcript_47836/g.96508 Transcript_47836/m.96508 type:complete len:181 (-) Transcript_47836:52-594(-)